MRKKTFLIAAVGVMLLAACVLFFLPRRETLFDGDRISHPGQFALRFDRMNGADSETMALQAGDALRVSWKIESGYVDIRIGMEGEEPIYRADHRPAGDQADFDVEIPETGAYTVTVSARNAKGLIEFLKTENE
ncbi:MAG: hypothetical protein IJI53_15060 [Clostridia bacterium]|nr:hypothetical protein [Clostridia bacterium]MBR0409343.1 hypothetical protein [Clostridia bacterium]